MKKNMSKKIKLLIVIGVFLLLGLIIGTSYAFYMASVSQSGTNVVKSDCFKITYTDQDTIGLDNAYPLTDEQALELTPYQFTVKNVCENTQYYEVNLETLSSSTIDESKLKVKLDNKTAYLYGSDGYASNKVISDAKNAIKLASGILTKNQEKTYSLRLYVDENVTTSTPNIQNKSYLGKVTIYAALNNRNFSIAIQRNNSTIKEDRVQGTKLDGVQYEYDLTNTDITNATNISCNEDAQAVIEDNKLKISNMHENTICKINDTIKSTIDTLDDSLTNIKMIKNEDNVEKMTVGATNDVVLDLNGKEINSIGVNETDSTWNSNHILIRVNGLLTINDSIGSGGMYTGNSARIISSETNGKVIVNGGNYSARNDIAVVGDNSYAEINGGTFYSKLYTILSTEGCNNCQLKVNDGIFNGPLNNYIIWMKSNTNSKIIVNGGTYNTEGVLYTNNPSNSGTMEINGGTFTSTGRTINNNSGTININGGSFESTGDCIIYNAANGTININGGLFNNLSNNPYISLGNGLITIDNGTFTNNYGYGIITLESNQGTLTINNGTFSSLKRTIENRSGTVNINNGSFTSSTEQTIHNNTGIINLNGGSYYNLSTDNKWNGTCVKQVDASGTININNGTFDCKGYGINNEGIGSINIKDSNVKTYEYQAIYNQGAYGHNGTMNICKVNLLNNKGVQNGNGYIYYHTNAFGSVTPTFAGTTANIQVKDDVCN